MEYDTWRQSGLHLGTIVKVEVMPATAEIVPTPKASLSLARVAADRAMNGRGLLFNS